MSDSQDTFIFNGQRLAYNRLKHNNYPASERAVEIPIAYNFIAGLKDKSRLLEVGNVLQYYPELIPTDIAEIQARRIIDKYETAVGVDKIDLMDADPEEKYSGIICISTVEHIGQGSDPSEAYGEEQEKYDWQGPLKAIAKIYDLLSDHGRALITVPFGKFLERGWYIQFSQDYLNLLFEPYNIPKNAVSASYLKLVKVDPSQPQPSVWEQANPEELVSAQYNAPFPFANAIAVLDITKIPATRGALTQPPTADKQPLVFSRVTSKLCVNRDFETDYYEHWIDKLQASKTIHRKNWEWVVMSQALNERGFLKPGKKGMGFAVGNEPLPSAFASLGCEIVATDQNYDIPEAQEHWATTDQLCRGKQALNEKQICPPETFDKLVSFREVDMNNIPEDLKQGEFDFIWSSCAFEHIGSIEHGLRFAKESLKCLKPGGMAIHTTEFNCSSNEGTLNTDNLVFFRHRDIQRLISELTAEGYRVEPPDYWMGDSKYDLTPMKDLSNQWAPHLKIELGGYIATSLLLIIHKPQEISAESYPPVYAYSEKQQELIKIFYDISVLGYGHYDSRSRTGVARVIENIASGLIASKELDLSFCATNSWYAVKSCLDYLQTQPNFRGIPLAHSSFFKNFESKLMELYKMLENREKIFPEHSQEPQSKLLTDNLKKYLSNSIGISKQRSHLIDQESLSEADIFHATFYQIPNQARECKKVKKIATVYDLIPILLSQLFIGKNDEDYQRMQASLNSLTAEDYILCISQATKNDLLNHVKLNPERVLVTHLAANTALFYRCNDAENMASVKHKYGIPDAPYILGVSTLEPRKNLEHVIRCFAKVVQQQGIKDLNLVLVGAKGWEYEKIFQEIANFGLSKDRIIITGYVADEDLAVIYSGAMVFVYPSLYEGFGLPPLEAMQCGIPVLTSNNSSFPEVVGDAGVMLNPTDADGLCHSILTLYRTPALRQEMSLKSLAQAKKFSWERCTQETIAAYKTALSG
ncbi:glycosyltransferase [Microcoleus sp. w1-18aA5]|uniref:glycosyltransferase n=1 Tax=Microcoleus sp. w1-18aA5 TaxID=2818982 RepID=UPI002FD63353